MELTRSGSSLRAARARAMADRLTAWLGRHPIWVRAVTSALIAIATWPTVNRVVPIGLDPSWAVALHLALRDGLVWGRDLVFTYGPLGFLGAPDPWVGASTVAALAAIGAVHLSLCATLLWTLSRVLPLSLAAVCTFLLAQTFLLTDLFTLLTALVALACVAALAGRLPAGLAERPAILAAVLGVVTTVALLGKLNNGMFIAAMGGVTALAIGRPAWRAAAAFGVSGGVVGLAVWLLTGGSLTDLPPWLRSSTEIVGGYSAVMGVDLDVTKHWRYLAFAVLVGLIGNNALAVSAAWPAVRRWGLLALVAVIVYAMWKVGFVRWYSAYAFIVLTVLLVAVLAPGRGRAMTLATLALAYVVIIASAMVPPARILDPRPALRTFRDSVAAALLPDRRDAAVEAVRARQRELYGIEPPILAALRGHTVHVDPTQVAVLHAYPDLAWRPLPVFQAYSAYTPGLDALNAEAVRGPEAPDRILREAPYVQPGGTLQIPVTIDGRFRWWDQPATTLEIWCRYEEVAASARWQVLARTDRRCEAPQPLTTIESGSARTVDVPEPPRDRFLLVRIRGLEPSAVDQVGTVLFKPLEWYALLDGVRYRLVQTTAADGLLLAVPPGDEGSAPFAFGPPIRTLRIESAVLVPLRFEFFTVARSP